MGNVIPLARHRGEGACVCAECNPHAHWLRQQDMAAEIAATKRAKRRRK